MPDLDLTLDAVPLPKFDAPKVPDEVESCSCAKKPKPKKKRKPRAVCYRGTYRETSSKTVKKALEEVPCKGRAATPKARAPGRKTKSIGDLAKDIFNVRFTP